MSIYSVDLSNDDVFWLLQILHTTFRIISDRAIICTRALFIYVLLILGSQILRFFKYI